MEFLKWNIWNFCGDVGIQMIFLGLKWKSWERNEIFTIFIIFCGDVRTKMELMELKWNLWIQSGFFCGVKMEF